MPFTVKEPVHVDSVPSPVPSPTPTPTPVVDKKPDNIIPFVAKEPAIPEEKVQATNPDPTAGVIAPPESPLTDTQSQSANPDPTLSKPDLNQTSNEVGLGGSAPEIASPPTQWSDTPTGQALITKVQNPLGLPADVAAKLINDAVAPRMPNSNPEVSDYPMGSGKPPPSRALGFTTKEPVQLSQPTGFISKEPPQPGTSPITVPSENQGPELIGQEDWKKWDEQIKPYDDDPDKISKSGIPDIKHRLTLMLYAQTKKEMRESGFHYDDVQKTIDDANNAVKTVGGWIAGAKSTVQDALQIPSQVTGFLGNAIEAGGAANREGSNPLKPPKGKIPSEMGIGAGNIPANTPLTSGDIYTGGIGTQPSDEVLQQRSDQAKRALVSGVEEGADSNVEFAENVISGLIGLTSTAPNAVMRVFGGPQVGYIDPKVQTWLATLPNPVPILSGKGWNSMDAPEMLSNLIAQDVQNNIHSARSSGHLDQNSQELLNTWSGHTVNTPESGARNGFPTPLKAIQDTAGTTNLLMGYPEFGLWGRLAEASGLNNMVGLMAKKTLQGGADLAEGVAERADISGNLKAIRLKDEAIKDIAQTGETAIKGGVEQVAKKVGLPPALDTLGKQVVDKVLGNSMGLVVSHAVGIPFPVSLATAPFVSQVLKTPLRVAGALAKSAGWIPKVISSLSDEIADTLKLAADDPENILATRSPLKQFLAQGINRATEGAATMAIPAALGSKTPEEFGSLMTMGAGMGLVGHALPDLVKGLQTQLIDQSFITDNNRYRSRTLAPDPMAYGTNSALDAQTKIAMNSTDPSTGNPLFTNSKRHVLNDLQSHYAPIAEIHVLNPKPYAAEVQRMADLGHVGNDPQLNSYGVSIDPNPGINKARILIRSDHFDDAIHHEIGHAITNRMTPDDLRTSFLAYSKTNDPNEFTRNYTQRAKPGSGGVTYDQLPTEEGLAAGKEKYVPGFEGMTKDDMEKEMATEAVSGLLKGGSIRDLTRDPTMLHNMKQVFWRVLDDLGFDPVTTRAISPLGLNQSIPAAMVLEPILRDTLKANRGAAEGAPSLADKKRLSPLGPVNPDEATIQGLMKKGFDRKQAEDFVAQNKEQSRTGPATTEAMQISQISPAQRARNILRGDHKFSAEDAKKYVPEDTKVASEAVVNALEAKAKESGTPNESESSGLKAKLVDAEGNVIEAEVRKGRSSARTTVGEMLDAGGDSAVLAQEALKNGWSRDDPMPKKGEVKGEPKNADELEEKIKGIEKEIGVGKGSEESPFIPSKNWQEQPSWAVVPSHLGGFDRRTNSAGKVEVKWSNPPPQEEVSDKRTGKSQKNAAGEEVVPKSESKPPETPGTPAKKPRKPGPPKGASPPIIPATSLSSLPQPQSPATTTPEIPQTPEKPKEISPSAPEEPPLETTPENVENIQALQKEEGLKPGPAQRVVTGKGKKSPKKRSKAQAQVPFESAKQRAIDELSPKDRSDWETWNKQGKINQGEPSEPFKRGNEVNDRVMARASQIQDEVAKGQSQKGSLHPNQGEIPDQPGHIGYYGYVGDSGWDDASGMGIGGFPFSNHKGFLIPRYSAAMKMSEGARRGLLPGQEFSINGIKMRWDDVVPASSPVGIGYVDLYDPSQPPDRGVSPEKIAYQTRIAEGRPGNIGQMGAMSPGESIVSQSLSGKPGAPEPPSPKIPEPPKEEQKTEAPIEITSSEIKAADQQAQESIKQGGKTDEAYRETINSKVIEQIGPKHAETLSPDDQRVKFDPDSGWMTGKYFDPNDAFHQWLLRNQSPEILGTLQKIEAAIASKKDLFVDYGSAPQKEKGLATAEQREKAQEASTPSERDKGIAMIQQAGKNVLPSYVGISKAGDIIYGGVSPDKIASNAAQITHRLGPQSPYKPGPLGDKVAESDLRGYLWNQQNGWKGDGSAKLKTVEGGTKVPEETEGFVPYEMPASKGDFWNLAIAGKGTRLGTARMKEGQSTSSGRAAELALLNEGMATKKGVVNPLHQKIESETPGWTDKHLHSGYELLRASLTKSIHPSGELPSEPIHPGHEEMAKAMTEKGLPKSQQVKAGFMPGEGEPSTEKTVQTKPIQPILTTPDRLKKNEHLRSQLEKQQAKLDTSNPEEDKQWDTLAQRIHDLENEHAALSSESGKANWMPGDVIEHPETGEREVVKSAALRIGNRIFTGPAHVFAHMNAEEELGRHVKKGEAEEGFITEPTTQYPEGRFIDRTAAWKLGQANKQIVAGSKPLEEMALYKNQKTMTGGKMEGLRSEDLIRPGTNYMPGETYTNSVGSKVKMAENDHAEPDPGDWMRYPNSPREKQESSQYSPSDKAYFMPGPEAIPTTFRETKKGDMVPVRIPYDIITSPLVKDHQPDAITKDSPDTLPKDQYKYLTGPARKLLSAYDKSSATGTFANKIVREAKKAMQNPEIAAGEGWYSRMRDLLSQALGKDHELFSHLLGVTSPMENPTDNFLYALEAYDKYKNGDYDRHIDLYRKSVEMKKSGDLVNHVKDLTGKDFSTNASAMDAYMEHHELIPKRDSGKLYGFHSKGVLQALARTWLEESKAPKTKNYAGNLFGTSTQATIDTWMARMMRRLGYEGSKEPWRIMPQSEKQPPSDLDFAFSQRAFDISADKMSKNLGRRLNADDLQAILWFSEKDFWEKKGWMKGLGAEKSSLDVPFHTAYPQGPKGPRLPHAEVRAKLRPGSEPEPVYAGAEEE